MNQSSTVFLYQAYGSTAIYNQALFSLLTLYYQVKGDFDGHRIIVYTDKAAVFEQYAKAMPITVEVLTTEAIRAYKGEANFVHRIKICLLQDCFAKYKSDILYLDSDTYFTQPPAQLLQLISPSTSIMNTDDYDLLSADELYENTDWLLIRRAIKNYSYLINKEEVNIPLTTRMWNAGVIGVSFQNAPLLEQVLALSDQIFANKPVFTAEQFAFSYVLQNQTNLISSGEVIFHYWRDWGTAKWKTTYNHFLRLFFKENRSQEVRDQAKQAFLLTQRHEELKLPEESVISRLTRRLKLIAKVAIEGRGKEY